MLLKKREVQFIHRPFNSKVSDGWTLLPLSQSDKSIGTVISATQSMLHHSTILHGFCLFQLKEFCIFCAMKFAPLDPQKALQWSHISIWPKSVSITFQLRVFAKTRARGCFTNLFLQIWMCAWQQREHSSCEWWDHVMLHFIDSSWWTLLM